MNYRAERRAQKSPCHLLLLPYIDDADMRVRHIQYLYHAKGTISACFATFGFSSKACRRFYFDATLGFTDIGYIYRFAIGALLHDFAPSAYYIISDA